MTLIEEAASNALDGETDNPRYDELVLHLVAAIRYLAKNPSEKMVDAMMAEYGVEACSGDCPGCRPGRCPLEEKAKLEAALLAALEE